MTCPNCGTELDNKFKTNNCPICGSAIEWVEEPEPEPVKKGKKEKEEEPYDPYNPIEEPASPKKPVVTPPPIDDPYNPPGGSGNGGKNGSGKNLLTIGIAVLLLVGVIEGGIIIKNSISDKKHDNQTEYVQNDDKEDSSESLMIKNNDKESAETDADAEAEAAAAAEEEAKRKAAEEEARKKAEEEARKKAEEEARKKEEEKAEAQVLAADYGILNSFSKARVVESWASSVVQDNTPGINNEPEMMVDGNEVTSWQEGAPGDGVGETVKFTLDQTCNVQYITFKMGNWRDQRRYDENHRPKSIKLKVGKQEFTLDFPNGKKEYMVAFSKPINAKNISLEIKSTYPGTMTRDWQDCCISEMTVYKK